MALTSIHLLQNRDNSGLLGTPVLAGISPNFQVGGRPSRADLDILVLGGLYNGRSRNLMKIQAPLGGFGGMPPRNF